MVPYIHGYAFALAEVLLSCHLILHKDQIRYDIRLDKLGYQKPSKNYYMIPDDKCIGRHFFFFNYKLVLYILYKFLESYPPFSTKPKLNKT